MREHIVCNKLAQDICKKYKLKISHFCFDHKENDSHWFVMYDDGLNIRENLQACCKYSAIYDAVVNHKDRK
jgi:iron-sulfur cluster repair protein YtfE (RIC family)